MKNIFATKITFIFSFLFFFAVKTCGKPNIQNIMNNVTVKPGESATFKCQVDMSCIVAYIEWYHEMDNGTEKLIKVGLTNLGEFFAALYINDTLMLYRSPGQRIYLEALRCVKV